jgi:glucan phosphoethanolaminetransferase (alkaline phosphatase superfamily)
MIKILIDNSPFEVDVSNVLVWVFASLVLVGIIAFHVLRAIGLYKLAKNKKLKCAFMAWIPGVWIFVAIKLIGETHFFGKSMEKLAVLLTIIFAVAEVLTLAYNLIIYFPYIGNFLMGNTIYIDQRQPASSLGYYELWGGIGLYGIEGQFVNPYKNIDLIEKLMKGIYYASAIFDIAYAVIIVTVLINLFKKYWPQHYVLASILSLFGLDSIFIFLIRNKKPIKYTDYLRSRYQNHPAQGPYGPFGPNPYANQGYNKPSQPETPFEQFKDEKDKKPEEPFSGFSDKN